jgi:hypothetical protein
MSKNIWIAGTSTAPVTAANWFTGSVPVDGDDIDVDGRAQLDLAGADQHTINPAFLRIYKSCTKNIGTNSAGTLTAWQIGPAVCDINLPSGSGGTSTGPPSIVLDFGSDACVCTVHGGRKNGTNGFSCVMLAGTSASNTLLVKGGSVSVGKMTPGQASTFGTIDITGESADVDLGSGLTWTTINLEDGKVHVSSAGTTLNIDGGEADTSGSGAITTINVSGGTLTPNSTGAVTDLNISGTATVDMSQTTASRTYTNCTLSGPDCKLNANNGVPGTIIFPNGIALTDGASSSQVDIGGDVTLLIAAYISARVVVKATNYTVTASDTEKCFTTDGAAGTVTFSMPAAVVGLKYRFRVGAAQELRIDPNGTETIALPSTGVQGAAGKYLVADANGETVDIECTKTGQWSVFGFTGTWTAEA